MSPRQFWRTVLVTAAILTLLAGVALFAINAAGDGTVVVR